MCSKLNGGGMIQQRAKKIRDDNKKFGKLLDLIQALSSYSNGMTYDQIMELMEYSDVRQANRDIGFIRVRFADSFSEERDRENHRIKRFRLYNPDGLPLENLNDKELVALAAAIRSVNNDDIRLPLEKLQHKINLFLTANKRRKVSRYMDLDSIILSRAAAHIPHPHIETDEDIVHQIDSAILAYQKINITYKYDNGATKEYLVRPLGFLYGKNNNYLIAYRDSDPDIVRSYVLGNITRVTPTNQSFDAGDFDIETYANKSFGIYHSPDGPFNIEWRAAPDVADAVMRYSFHPTQKLKKNPDGSVTITFQADGFMEMALYLFQWRGKIVPIAPDALVQEYRGLLNTALKSLG